MTYYLDADYRVHIEQNDDGTLMPWEDTDGVFDNKCSAYVHGYRVVPEGCAWTRSDGVTFAGQMIAPAVDISVLNSAQGEYETMRTEMLDMHAALTEIGVIVDE